MLEGLGVRYGRLGNQNGIPVGEAQAMPLFDFRCRSCGSEFEALVRASDVPKCPSCKSAKLEQLPSTFSVSSLEITKARVRTATKERRRSRDYRDKLVADRESQMHHD
jgi:putative FmdB family regulatory protein